MKAGLAARRRLARPHDRTSRGQSIVELAIFMPLILVFGLACIQFAIIFTAYLNVMQVARDAGRWVSVNPHKIDTGTGSTEALIKTRLPAGLSANALSLTFSPACSSLSSGRCTNRPVGTTISTTATYTITSHLFLPTSFGWGAFVVTIPTNALTYTYVLQVEPS